MFNAARASRAVEKKRVRRILLQAAKAVLAQEGWTVVKLKGRIFRISKNGEVKTASIKTSQDRCLAFQRTLDDTRWAPSLADVDFVVASSVDDVQMPKLALVHIFDARKVDASVGRRGVAVAAALSLGREMRAALAAEAQAKSCCFVAQLLVDAARGH